MHFRTLNTQFFGLTVDAFTTGALRVNGLVERSLTIQGHAHKATRFPVGIFLTAFAFEKLLMVADLASRLRKEQWAEKALGAVAMGVIELERGQYAQPLGTDGHPIAIPGAIMVSMPIEWHGGDAVLTGGALVDATSHQRPHRR